MPSKKTFRSGPVRRRFHGGFSLMELLMVMVITPMIFFAVYSSFSMGTRLWARLSQTGPEEDVSLFYIKAGRDLRGMLRFQDLPFSGEEGEMTFAGAVQAPVLLGGDRGIGTIRIFYDARDRAIKREVRDYSQVYREAKGSSSVLLRGVKDFALSYYTSDPLQADLFWTSEWDAEATKLPVAVRMKFTLEGSDWPFEHTEFIPVGGVLQ